MPEWQGLPRLIFGSDALLNVSFLLPNVFLKRLILLRMEGKGCFAVVVALFGDFYYLLSEMRSRVADMAELNDSQNKKERLLTNQASS